MKDIKITEWNLPIDVVMLFYPMLPLNNFYSLRLLSHYFKTFLEPLFSPEKGSFWKTSVDHLYGTNRLPKSRTPAQYYNFLIQLSTLRFTIQKDLKGNKYITDGIPITKYFTNFFECQSDVLSFANRSPYPAQTLHLNTLISYLKKDQAGILLKSTARCYKLKNLLSSSNPITDNILAEIETFQFKHGNITLGDLNFLALLPHIMTAQAFTCFDLWSRLALWLVVPLIARKPKPVDINTLPFPTKYILTQKNSYFKERFIEIVFSTYESANSVMEKIIMDYIDANEINIIRKIVPYSTPLMLSAHVEGYLAPEILDKLYANSEEYSRTCELLPIQSTNLILLEQLHTMLEDLQKSPQNFKFINTLLAKWTQELQVISEHLTSDTDNSKSSQEEQLPQCNL